MGGKAMGGCTCQGARISTCIGAGHMENRLPLCAIMNECTDEQRKLVVSAQAYRPGHHSRLTMEFIGCIGCRQPCARTFALAGTADADMLPGSGQSSAVCLPSRITSSGSFGSRSDVGAAHDAPIPKRREDATRILPVDAPDPHRVRME